MRIVKLTENNDSKAIKEAQKVLEKGGLVVIPSDTAYGLAANAKSKKAIEKIFDFKGRKFGKAISIFLKDVKTIGEYARLDKRRESVVKSLLPGPFTLILKSKNKVAPGVEATDNTIGIRVIKQKFVNSLLERLDFPITATSANLSGKGPHYSISSFLKTLSSKKKERIDLIVDAGKLTKKPTSTVLRLVEDEMEILRPGLLNPQVIKEYESKSEKETMRIAQQIYDKYLAQQLKNNSVVVALKGNLGVGKTVFAKGIGKLFYEELISPTFVLMDEYKINKGDLKSLYHLDLYRIEREEEIINLQLDKLLDKGNLILIEWGEKLSTLKSLKREGSVFYLLQIDDKGKDKRLLTLYKI